MSCTANKALHVNGFWGYKHFGLLICMAWSGCCGTTENDNGPPPGFLAIQVGTALEPPGSSLSGFGKQAHALLGDRLPEEAANSRWFDVVDGETGMMLFGLVDYVEIDTSNGIIRISDQAQSLDFSGTLQVKGAFCQATIRLKQRRSDGKVQLLDTGRAKVSVTLDRSIDAEVLKRWRASGNLNQQEMNIIRVNDLINEASRKAIASLATRLPTRFSAAKVEG